MRRNRIRRGAFTLMETLLAVALLAALFTAATALLFQVTSLWASQSDDALLDRHVDGVDRFVRRLFAESGAARVTTPDARQIERERAILAFTGTDAELPWVTPLVTEGGRFECRLGFDAETGLWLWWNTAGERARGAIESHRTRLSPWVRLAAVYRMERDGREWTELTAGETLRRSPGVPYALRLEFEHRGRVRALTLLLPAEAGVP